MNADRHGALETEPTSASGWLTRARALLVVQVAALLVLTASVATRTWQDHLSLAVLLVGGSAVAWWPALSRPGDRRLWFFYVWGIFVYTVLRSVADETFIATRIDYVIRIDRAIFFGTDPIPWLQGRWFDPASTGWLDRIAVGVHWSFFLVPHIAAVVIFLVARREFPRYLVAVVGTMYLGLLIFFLAPTAPPWLASNWGHLPGVYRVMHFVGGEVDRDTYDSFYSTLGEPNSVAAMPSIHMGVAVAMLLWAWPARRWAAAFFLAFAAATAFALAYMGEHYVTDMVIGTVCAALATLLGRAFLARYPAALTGEKPPPV